MATGKVHPNRAEEVDVPTLQESDWEFGLPYTRPPQLLKWVGNKHRSALSIAQFIPDNFRTYVEPFLGGAAVLGTLAPPHAIGGDILEPLIAIWKTVQSSPSELIDAYAERLYEYTGDPAATYDRIRKRYNNQPNRDDLLFLSRSCYGGVMRFTRGRTISTPIGPHKPISAQSLRRRIEEWRPRIRGIKFVVQDFEETISDVRASDVVYCDPPYTDTQAILYGAQAFSHERMFRAIEASVQKGAKVLLSLDATKKSGKVKVPMAIPAGLFKRQVLLGQGGSMLRRFQKKGESMEGEHVQDRLLLTW